MTINRKKLVPIADVVQDFRNSNEGKQLFEILKKRKEEDPARYNMQYNHKLLNETQSVDGNFSCAMSRLDKLNQMRSIWENNSEHFDESKFDILYEEYHNYILTAAQHIKAYKAQKKKLEWAVVQQDRIRNGSSINKNQS